jgi:hypothetical protein
MLITSENDRCWFSPGKYIEFSYDKWFRLTELIIVIAIY